MRKVLGIILLFVFLLSMCGIGFAQVEGKRAELSKIQVYIKSLDSKIEKARAAKQINKVAELREQKRKQQERADLLKKEIAALEQARVKIKPEGERKRGFQVGAGYGGGAGIIGVGYARPISESIGLVFDAGYGIGNGYSVIIAEASGIYSFGKAFAGLGLAATSYSNKVTDIPGLSGTFDKGTRFGAELFFGYSFGSLMGKIGYNTGLAGGLTAGASYLF